MTCPAHVRWYFACCDTTRPACCGDGWHLEYCRHDDDRAIPIPQTKENQ